MTNFNEFQKSIKYWEKTLMAIDFGSKVTGLALFTPGRDPYPTPYDQINYKNHSQLINEIIKFIKFEAVSIVILGVPTLLDGKETSMTLKIKDFGNQLKESLLKELPKIEFFYQDESLSTFEAQDRMKRSPRYNFKVDYSKIDALSASIVLEDFLRSN